ncbi:MAG: long-chain fatty acid--CoA ligase [Thermaerobacter sp.]|nr:long-chain fatty acid--CoA ligase [Thermaerobacter sp.]
MASIAQILERNARRAPEREALVYESARYTYRQLNDRVNQTARALALRSVDHGDRVALMCPNTDEFVIAYYAILRLGALVVPINARLAPPELEYQLKDSGATLILFDPSLSDVVDRALKLWSVDALPLTPHADRADLATLANQQSTDALNIQVHEWDDAQILYTSGTTGLPKGVLMDHHRVIWTALNVVMGTGLGEGERLLHVAPLYHSAELDLFLMGGTYLAATHVILGQFHPAGVVKTLASEHITAFFGVPTMYQFMLRDPDFDSVDLSAWRVGMFGAAPMPPSTVLELAERLPHLTLYNLAGLTEMGPGGVFLGGDELKENPGAAGRPILNTEARVVDAEGHDVGPGVVGELWLTGETLMKGYWNKPGETKATMHGDWLKTGDLASFDARGLITLVDRMKDMVITGGMNVYSVEVENVLITHPAILDCAVIGVPHPDYGETLTAIVSLKPDHSLTLDDLKDFCRSRIAAYKIPRKLIITAIPRNASGKILKYQLRQQYGQGNAAT